MDWTVPAADATLVVSTKQVAFTRLGAQLNNPD
jgi:hypothetical protein